MEYEKSDYKMPRESARASNDLAYKESREDFYKRCPKAKILDDKLDRGEITVDEAIAEIIKQAKKEQKLLEAKNEK